MKIAVELTDGMIEDICMAVLGSEAVTALQAGRIVTFLRVALQRAAQAAIQEKHDHEETDSNASGADTECVDQ